MSQFSGTLSLGELRALVWGVLTVAVVAIGALAVFLTPPPRRRKRCPARLGDVTCHRDAGHVGEHSGMRVTARGGRFERQVIRWQI